MSLPSLSKTFFKSIDPLMHVIGSRRLSKQQIYPATRIHQYPHFKLFPHKFLKKDLLPLTIASMEK